MHNLKRKERLNTNRVKLNKVKQNKKTCSDWLPRGAVIMSNMYRNLMELTLYATLLDESTMINRGFLVKG